MTTTHHDQLYKAVEDNNLAGVKQQLDQGAPIDWQNPKDVMPPVSFL